MINILIVEEPIVTAVSWWRLFRPIAEMQRQYPGRFNVKMVRNKSINADDLFFTDIFILCRPKDEETLSLAQRIKALGRGKIILDIDDAITNLPINHFQYAHHNNRVSIVREIFTLVDYFWVSTEQLLYECDCIGKGEVIPNAIYAEDLPKEPSPDKGLWMWRGGGLQILDVLIAGAEKYEEIKGKAKQWVFWGVLPPIAHPANITLLEYESDVQTYFEKLKSAKINGVWKPLVDNAFNDSKSNIAWIEATMSGGVCLTNYAGKLAWENAVSEFPTYEEARVIWAESRERIIQDFNLEKTARQRAESIDRLLGDAISI